MNINELSDKMQRSLMACFTAIKIHERVVYWAGYYDALVDSDQITQEQHRLLKANLAVVQREALKQFI